jgi:hypothetical protein
MAGDDERMAAAIWDRATEGADQAGLLDGDRLLAHALVLHGVTMNGGLLHAVGEVFGAADVEQAAQGFEWLELHDAADVVRWAVREGGDPRTWTDALEAEAGRRYGAALPREDETIFEAFECKLAERGDSFMSVG